ncbi:hypothetical protein [Neorhizobium petrolearium]|uniref:hypothetical protein n=1 Tax=Neorhizobium petrolearium TaxID=515361 RepID=UPI003F7E9885
MKKFIANPILTTHGKAGAVLFVLAPFIFLLGYVFKLKALASHEEDGAILMMAVSGAAFLIGAVLIITGRGFVISIIEDE